MIDEKIRRQQVLLSLIEGSVLSRQSEVASALKSRGFDSGQPIISRDFRELGIVKLGGRYMKSPALTGGARAVLEPLKSLVLRAEPTGPNLLVIKTRPGAANLIAASIDKSALPQIAGTVAGDDTIFVATRSRRGQTELLRHLNTYSTEAKAR